jgi:hypothetical protein
VAQEEVLLIFTMGPMPRLLAATIITALLIAGCGSRQGDESGAVSTETVKQLEDVLHARAQAMGKGDRDAFLKTIDTTKPAFRRAQLAHFEIPNYRGGLGSTFKLSGVERYRGFVRGFVEETRESNVFPGSFLPASYSRQYFRSDSGRWLITEPTGDETGPEKQRTAPGVELSYWAMDEDVASVLLLELEDARRVALTQSPRPQEISLKVAFVPTAELAGPGWDAFLINGGGPPGTRQLLYAMWYSFDQTRSRLHPSAQLSLVYIALTLVREGIAPGVDSRLLLNRWLNWGWLHHASGFDVSTTLKQSCLGMPIPTLKQLADGPPQVAVGVAPEVYGRFYAYAASMVAFLIEKYGNDAFWQLMSAFVQNASATTNFPAILKTTPDEFYAAWLVWLKKKYC